VPSDRKPAKDNGDLIIIIGSEEEEEELQYQCHFIVMAGHSNYIKTVVTCNMRESQSMKLRFPDIAPDTWEAMMEFLENPVAARGMIVQDAVLLTPYYDKYDFPKGRTLCNVVLKEHIETARSYQRKDFDLDLYVRRCRCCCLSAQSDGCNRSVYF
jgi:hypothetical protein